MSGDVWRAIDELRKSLEAVRTRERSFALGARVYNSADITLTTGVLTALTFDSERWDDAGFHSTSVNTNRLTIPQAGRYLVGASIVFASNATGIREVYLFLNNTTRIADELRPAVSGSSTRIVINTVYAFAVGDYLECYAYQDSGGNLNVTAAGNYTPEYWIQAC